eukprot:GHVP01005465.1.p1 GENE.GHVP01005465.1~~GHVP01005465.1.p1  ORF type:complete len:166 (+),score=29.85 GHVP01005465.1:101-598(+)
MHHFDIKCIILTSNFLAVGGGGGGGFGGGGFGGGGFGGGNNLWGGSAGLGGFDRGDFGSNSSMSSPSGSSSSLVYIMATVVCLSVVGLGGYAIYRYQSRTSAISPRRKSSFVRPTYNNPKTRVVTKERKPAADRKQKYDDEKVEQDEKVAPKKGLLLDDSDRFEF